MHMLITYFRIISLRFMGATQYKADFMIGVSGLLIQQLVVVLVIFTIFSGVDQLAGFALHEVLIILGLAQLVRGLDLAYNDYIWVEAFNGFAKGSLYHYMTRPMPIYLQILSNRLNIQSLGPIGIGLFILATSIPELDDSFAVKDYLLLFYFILCGMLTLFSVKLLAAALALWVGRSGEFMQVIHEFVEFVCYPLNIYALPLQVLLTIILPFGVISFIPALYWLPHIPVPLFTFDFALEHRETFIIFYISSISMSFFALSQWVWRKGLQHASTSGT